MEELKNRDKKDISTKRLQYLLYQPSKSKSRNLNIEMSIQNIILQPFIFLILETHILFIISLPVLFYIHSDYSLGYGSLCNKNVVIILIRIG